MLAYIEVSSNHVDERQGVGQTGRSYHLRQQTIYLHQQGQPYPEKFDIMLEERQLAYEPGFYVLGAGSFERHYKTGSLSFARNLKLLPLAEAVTKINELSQRSRPKVAA